MAQRNHFYKAMKVNKRKENKNTEIKARVTPLEKEKIKKLAEAHGLSLSDYIRQAALTQELKNAVEVETVLALTKVNADQARLGNLLKMAIDEFNEKDLERLIREIRKTQEDIKNAVLRL